MSATDIHKLSEFAIQLAHQAGDIIREERRHANYETSLKHNEELVTSADLHVDRFISDCILSVYPDHRILSEEGANDLANFDVNSGPLWVVDPIDGTVNFAYGHNQLAVSIAYFEQGVVKAGVVHAPFQNETFQAVREQGATLNQQPIKVSECFDFRQALIATGFPYHKRTMNQLITRLHAVLSECRDLRRIGSAALDICWVAAGRLDGYYESLSPWDFAAAQLIAMEAGARCGRLYPVPENIPEELFGDDVIVTSPAIYEQLTRLLINADKKS